MGLFIGLMVSGGIIGLMILLVRRITEAGTNDQPHSRRDHSLTHNYGSIMDPSGNHCHPHHGHGPYHGHGHPHHDHGPANDCPDSSSGDSGGDSGGGDGGSSGD